MTELEPGLVGAGALIAKVDLGRYPHVRRRLDACMARPAAQRALGRRP